MNTSQAEPMDESHARSRSLALTPELTEALRVFAHAHGLTNREVEVLQVLVEGTVSAVQIAERLGLSRNTVHNHIGNIFRRTRTHSKASVLACVIHHMARSEAPAAPGLAPAH